MALLFSVRQGLNARYLPCLLSNEAIKKCIMYKWFDLSLDERKGKKEKEKRKQKKCAFRSIN